MPMQTLTLRELTKNSSWLHLAEIKRVNVYRYLQKLGEYHDMTANQESLTKVWFRAM